MLLLLVALAAAASLPAASGSAAGAAAAAAARAGSNPVSSAATWFPLKYRRALLQNCGLTCDTLATCINTFCTSVTSTTRTVVLDNSSCKNGTLSWICCRTNACTPVNCTLGPLANNTNSFPTCNNVTSYSFTVPLNTTSIPIQIHDGSLAKSFNCTGIGQGAQECCAGGFQGGGQCNGVQAYIANTTTAVTNDFFSWFPLNGSQSNNFAGYFQLNAAPSTVGTTYTTFSPALIQPSVFMTEVSPGNYTASCSITLVSSTDTAISAAFYTAFTPPTTNSPGQLNQPPPNVSPPLPITMGVSICRTKNSTVITAG
ncbi:hypothetical protein HXX76_002475 [Chlamydomonas incerta]|uniref:Uncharacterized protein n=1 Tax=Chlamydomonas incerta TaxID=51695 RepID=A0A835TBJ3_CHLIN|nr:hypothetical protein HXX76_002475 [Chlamydomonas incerta]|eukprot:KAG2442389.1 hypothetical protein HXX76_002475 [Chlamydomonas incerta]